MKGFLKKLSQVLLYILIYIALVLILGIILINAVPKAEDGTSPSWCALVAVFAPALLIFLYLQIKKRVSRYKKETNQSTQNCTNNIDFCSPKEQDSLLIHSSDNEVVPSMEPKDSETAFIDPIVQEEIKNKSSSNNSKVRFPSKRKCQELISIAVAKANLEIQASETSSSIDSYLYHSQQAMDSLKAASVFEEKADCAEHDKPSIILEQLNERFQWKLRDAIEREKKSLILEINGPQHNNKRSCCHKFYQEIENNKSLFSDESYQYAKDAYQEILFSAGLNAEYEYSRSDSTRSTINDQISRVDYMEGHEFEYFCADLLRSNGFSNVAVTKGSGDQGIDIVANKDGIKYGIQCKCYSSDLGNKPVQEAFAGKRVYGCHVAAVLTNRFFTQGGVDAAKATGVLLWDRNKLISLIKSAAKN